MSLRQAWSVCCDGRWIYAAGAHGGARPRQLVAGLTALVLDLVAEELSEGWRSALEVSARYGSGQIGIDALTTVIPLPESAMRTDMRKLTPRDGPGLLRRNVDPYTAVTTTHLIEALRPETRTEERARAGGMVVASIAGFRGLSARRNAHAEASREMTSRGLPHLVPNEGAAAWQEAADRGFEHALSEGATILRRFIPSPFGEPLSEDEIEQAKDVDLRRR